MVIRTTLRTHKRNSFFFGGNKSICGCSWSNRMHWTDQIEKKLLLLRAPIAISELPYDISSICRVSDRLWNISSKEGLIFTVIFFTIFLHMYIIHTIQRNIYSLWLIAWNTLWWTSLTNICHHSNLWINHRRQGNFLPYPFIQLNSHYIYIMPYAGNFLVQ